MKTYLGNEIRNLAFVGHSHCGKTTLIEALLATAGTIPAMGSVEDGTAVTAYDEEEVTRTSDAGECGRVLRVERSQGQRDRYSGIQHVCAGSSICDVAGRSSSGGH